MFKFNKNKNQHVDEKTLNEIKENLLKVLHDDKSKKITLDTLIDMDNSED